MEGIRKIRVKESWARQRIQDHQSRYVPLSSGAYSCLMDLLDQVDNAPPIPRLVLWQGTQVELLPGKD